ncbi:lipoprotein, putative [Vibrio cholerae]|nr:lipoprotein, putative [Vibrio cholerae]
MLNKTTLLLAAVVTLSGCQATQRQNATTGETETNSATKGALIGAIAGAAVGLATGDDAKKRRKKALIGAAGGAAVGGGIGYYLDQQEAELRKALYG